MVHVEDGYRVRTLVETGTYTIDKVTEENGEIFYDVYDKEQNLQNTFRTSKEARSWAKMMFD